MDDGEMQMAKSTICFAVVSFQEINFKANPRNKMACIYRKLVLVKDRIHIRKPSNVLVYWNIFFRSHLQCDCGIFIYRG